LKPVFLFAALSTMISSHAFGQGKERCTLKYEIEGRISVFWNRAKYVRISERGEPSAPWKTVQEYVEIQEPTRRYSGDLIKACVFGSRVIPVNVQDRRDIEGEGWAVPLWSPAGGNPKPVISLELASTDGAQSVKIAEPERLAFYTSTRLSTDSDKWPPVPGIDFGAETLLPKGTAK
jgi:hypothetical protein